MLPLVGVSLLKRLSWYECIYALEKTGWLGTLPTIREVSAKARENGPSRKCHL